MQQAPNPSDSEQQQKLDWELASYGRRVGAWALDFIGFTLPFVLLILLVVVMYVFSPIFAISGEDINTNELIPIYAFLFVILISYVLWWLFALRRGQTPGKQIVGIRVIKDDGSPSGWGYTFLREFVIKFLLLGLVTEPTLGIARLVDYLWPLWDRAKKMQTLHDKLLGTLVVRKRG